MENENNDTFNLPKDEGEVNMSDQTADEGQEEINLTDITEQEFAEARRIYDADAAQDIKAHVDKAKNLIKEKEKREEGYSNDPVKEAQKQSDLYNTRLMNILAVELANTKEQKMKEQCTGIKGLFKFLGIYKPKEIDEEKLFPEVLDNYVLSIEKEAESIKLDRVSLKEVYTERKSSTKELNGSRNEFLDLYESGEIKKKALQEQVTQNIKAKMQYLEKKNSEDYDGGIDGLLNNTIESIDKLETELGELEETQGDLKEEISDMLQKTKLYGMLEDDSKRNYDVVNSEYRETKLTKDMLVELSKNEEGRSSVVGIYRKIAKNRDNMKKARSIIQESKKLIDVIFQKGIGSDGYKELDTIFGERETSKQYSRDRDARIEKDLGEAKALRYGLT